MVTIRNSKIVPFPCQSECLEILETVEKTQDAALVVMAGGLGKTILSALNVKRRFDTYGETRCLFLCHQNDILEQSELEYRKVFKGTVTYGFFHGEEKSNLDANIIFASFQTMRDNLDLFTKMDFQNVVVDESHHSKAETYEPVIRYFSPNFLLGITMYPDRLDGLDIRDIYGKEVYALSLVTALARGQLCPVDYRLMSDEIGSLKKLETVHGRLSIQLLNSIIFIPKRDKEIAEIIQSYMQTLDDPRAMIFCPSIEYAEMLAELITNTIPLHSKVTKTEKRVRLELFRNGTFKAATSVDMFNEGLDVPETNLIVFLRSTSSPNIYYNQLARGLRLSSGKEKVIVLDFVGNCERALEVYELWTKVKTERERLITLDKVMVQLPGQKAEQFVITPTTMNKSTAGLHILLKEALQPFSLNVDDVSFKEKIVPIIERIQKIREGFYPTWEEASEAVKKLSIKNPSDYVEKFRQDPGLVSFPRKYYEDFPGWEIFTGNSENARQAEDCYPTWQEASEAAIKLGIKNWAEYKTKYKTDIRLPSNPNQTYENFPGHLEFLKKPKPGQRWYGTWQEASVVVSKMGIKSFEDYQKRYKEDPKLPSTPHDAYTDFPGMLIFLKLMYDTLQEASKAAIKLGIKNRREYEKRYTEDPKLPANPRRYYEGFLGWDIFLGK